MRALLLVGAVVTFSMTFCAWIAPEMQMGEVGTKMHQTCAALAAEGIVTDQDKA